MPAIENKLRPIREAKGLSIDKLSVEAEVSPRWIAHIELNGHCPKDPIMQRLARVLGVQPSDIWPSLLKGETSYPPKTAATHGSAIVAEAHVLGYGEYC